MIDARDWIAATVKQEAEAEPYIGKLGVAFSIVNRMKAHRQSASQVVFAPYQYSCWNTTSPTRRRLDVDLHDQVWQDSYRAADEALAGTTTDPTQGCTSYLNPAVCTEQQKRNAGYRESLVRVRLGHHAFFIPL